jgi:hypothetical protein
MFEPVELAGAASNKDEGPNPCSSLRAFSVFSKHTAVTDFL